MALIAKPIDAPRRCLCVHMCVCMHICVCVVCTHACTLVEVRFWCHFSGVFHFLSEMRSLCDPELCRVGQLGSRDLLVSASLLATAEITGPCHHQKFYVVLGLKPGPHA